MTRSYQLITRLLIALAMLVATSPVLAHSQPEDSAAGSTGGATSIIPPSPDGGTELLLGQRQSYTATFRGNGEAIVYARLVISNPDEETLTKTSFEIPGQVTDLVIFQQKLAPVCAEYDYQTDGRECLRYQEPDYTQAYYYGSTSAEYKKIKPKIAGTQYSVELPFAVEPYKSTALILGYASKSYVTNRLGLMSFSFETIKAPTRVQSVSVAVDVDSDVYLKGKKSAVNYSPSLGVTTDLAGAPNSVSSKEMDSLVQSIGSSGALTKTASNLAAGESFTVRGQYTTSWLRLYLSSIVWTIVILALLGLLMVFLGRKFRSRAAAAATTISDAQPAAPTHDFLNPRHIGAGFLSALLVMILAAVTVPVMDFMSEAFGYSSSFMMIIAIIVWMLIYVFAIFGPAAYIGIQHGWRAFFAVMISQVVWFAILMILYAALYQTGITKYYDGPVPL